MNFLIPIVGLSHSDSPTKKHRDCGAFFVFFNFQQTIKQKNVFLWAKIVIDLSVT